MPQPRWLMQYRKCLGSKSLPLPGVHVTYTTSQHWHRLSQCRGGVLTMLGCSQERVPLIRPHTQREDAPHQAAISQDPTPQQRPFSFLLLCLPMWQATVLWTAADAQEKGTWEMCLVTLVCQWGTISSAGHWIAAYIRLHHKMANCLPSVPFICSLFLFSTEVTALYNILVHFFLKTNKQTNTDVKLDKLSLLLPSLPLQFSLPFPGTQRKKILLNPRWRLGARGKPEQGRACFLYCHGLEGSWCPSTPPRQHSLA